MENLPYLNDAKESDNIPPQEKIDPALSPVSQEEMDAELRIMQEAMVGEDEIEKYSEKDAGVAKQRSLENTRIEEIRRELRSSGDTLLEESIVIPPKIPSERGDDDEELEPIILREADVKYETCRNCKGKGRVMFSILRCPKCGGSGKAPAMKQHYKDKIVGYKKKGQ
ncbi:MAG: hypothetical protein NTZ38_03490 [Candidatus Taylorbacteria bacterium]|nr:hypothetical protein [Candidatus Taylorbacteria bacterium]